MRLLHVYEKRRAGVVNPPRLLSCAHTRIVSGRVVPRGTTHPRRPKEIPSTIHIHMSPPSPPVVFYKGSFTQPLHPLSLSYSQSLNLPQQLSVSTLPSMSSTIDHIGFPAIIESIIHRADFKTQLAFRATSKKYCTYVGKLHFKHALVEEDGNGDLEVMFPEHRLVAIPDGDYHMLYRSVEVVDVHLVPRRSHGHIKPFNSPTSVHTVRRRGWNSAIAQVVVPHNVRTVVDFLRTMSSIVDGDRITISSYQDRHIIHLKWTEFTDPVRPNFSFTLNSPTINLKELVIALWPEQASSARNVPCALWSAIIDLVDYLRFWGKLKIVGLERIAFRGVSIHCPDDFVSKFRWQLAEVDGIAAEHKYDVANAITCVTFEEWWKELGPRKAVEGLWNPLGQSWVSCCGHTGH